MSWRTTAALFIGLLVVAAAVLIIQRQPDGQEVATSTGAAPFVEALDLFDGVVIQDVARLEIVQADPPDEAIFERDPEGAWVQTVPTATQVFSATLTNQVTGLLNSRARRSFTPEGSDLAPYGLQEPETIVIIAAKRGGDVVRYELGIGDLTPTADAYYVLKPGDPRVHLISTAALDGLLRLLENVPLQEDQSP
jgi:hypothetical protein